MLDAKFESDPRRKQELRMRPIADKIYRRVFGDNIQIKRIERGEDATLDREFAIDVNIILHTGQILLGQEKFLSHKYSSFKSMTVEYYQNPITKEQGDWFKIATQFYFVGYCTNDESRFEPWVLSNWTNVVIETNNNHISWSFNYNQDGRARASFAYTKMDNLPDNCIIACSWKKRLASCASTNIMLK